MWAVYKKELKVYFNSILGYVIMLLFMGITGALFLSYYIFNESSVGNFANLFSFMNSIFLFIMPVLTLRLLAEDKKLGSYELLLTSPVTSWEIILGKFLAVLSFSLVGAGFMLLFPLSYAFVGKVHWEPLISSFLGMILSFSFFLSIGMAASSFTENYVVSGLISFGMAFFLFLITLLGDQVSGPLSRVFQEISFSFHYEKLSTGIFGIKDILYFIFGAFIWLFLAKTIVESKTWK